MKTNILKYKDKYLKLKYYIDLIYMEICIKENVRLKIINLNI
jgi:hypothetical protein